MGPTLRHAISLTVLLVSALSHTAHAEEQFVNRLVAHYAGMLGMVSLGVEHTTGSNSDVQLLAGYTPAWSAGVDIYSLGIRGNYVFNPVYEKESVAARLYTGIGFYYYFGDQYRTRDYPEGYYIYPNTAYHLMPYLGLRVTGLLPSHRDITFYSEAGMIDSYLIHYYHNYQTIGLSDVVTLALGVSVPLR